MPYSVEQNNYSGVCVILAAGKGSRMQSTLPKPLVPLAGKPLISWVLETVSALQFVPVVVENSNHAISERVKRAGITFVVQEQPNGPADALRWAMLTPELGSANEVLLLLGDSPLVPVDTLKKLLEHHRQQQSALTLLTGSYDQPTPFSWVERDQNGKVKRLSTNRPALGAEVEYSLGPIVMDGEVLRREMGVLLDSQAEEKRLEPLVAQLSERDYRIATLRVSVDDPILWGINTPLELEQAENYVRSHKLAKAK